MSSLRALAVFMLSTSSKRAGRSMGRLAGGDPLAWPKGGGRAVPPPVAPPARHGNPVRQPEVDDLLPMLEHEAARDHDDGLRAFPGRSLERAIEVCGAAHLERMDRNPVERRRP